VDEEETAQSCDILSVSVDNNKPGYQKEIITVTSTAAPSSNKTNDQRQGLVEPSFVPKSTPSSAAPTRPLEKIANKLVPGMSKRVSDGNDVPKWPTSFWTQFKVSHSAALSLHAIRSPL
jgi:hypothetical protein